MLILMPRPPAFYYLMSAFIWINSTTAVLNICTLYVPLFFHLHASLHDEISLTQISSVFCRIHLNQSLFQICILDVEALFPITIYLHGMLLKFLFGMIIHIRADLSSFMPIYSQPYS